MNKPPNVVGTSALRRLGYSILPGDSFSYLLHLRPKEWPIVAGHFLFGYLLAPPDQSIALVLTGLFAFVVLLNGGTLAINSAFDRDAGDIGYLDRPPPPPNHLFGFGMALMILGQIVSILWFPRGFTVVYAVCFAMSILYSVPPFRWKAVSGLDLLINALGFGILTPLAGWMMGELLPPPWVLILICGFGPLFAALYPLTQIYQIEEDRSRGDRTLAIALGVRRSLDFAASMAGTAFVIFAVGLWLRSGTSWAWLLLLPLAGWLVLLLGWRRRYETMSGLEQKRGMYRALYAWAATNVTVLLSIYGPHLIGR